MTALITCHLQLPSASLPLVVWAAQYTTWILVELTPKGVVFAFLFFSASGGLNCFPHSQNLMLCTVEL